METTPVRRSVGTLLLGSLVALASVGRSAAGDPPAAASTEASLSGVVVDEAGAPVGGADVAAYDAFAHLRRLVGGGSLEEPTPLEAAAHGTADAKGRFTLGGLAVAAYTVVASASGHGVGYLEGFPAATSGPPTLVVTLGPGVAVEGDVVDAGGKGVASAPVAIGEGFERETRLPRSLFSRAFGTTDATGHFRVERVPTTCESGPIRSYSVCVGGPDGWRCDRFLLDGLPHGPLTIRFGGQATRGGKVKDADGADVAGARVVTTCRLSTDAMAASGEPSGWTKYVGVTSSGADGTFRIAGAPAGASSSIEAYAGARGVGAASGVEVRANGETTVDVRLMPAVRLFGVLTAPDGTPAANTEVFALADAGAVWSGRSDAAGRFEMPGAIRRRMHLVVAFPGAVVPDALATWKVASNERESSRDVRLVAAANARGRILDPTGGPVEGAVVRVRRTPPALPGQSGSVDTRSGLDGGFLALGLEAEDVVVTSTKSGMPGGEQRATLVAGETVSGIDVRFEGDLPDPAKALDAGAAPGAVAADLRALVNRLQLAKVADVRARTIQRLRAVGSRGAEVVPALAALLNEPAPVGRDAADVLSSMGDAGALALASSLAGDVVATHEVAAQMLASMEAIPATARPALLRRLSDGAPLVRASCATALGRVTPADAASIEALVSALGDADARVVLEALGAIARLAPRDPNVAPALRPLLARADLRRPTLVTAMSLGPAAEPLVPDLVGMLTLAADYEVRVALADALGAIGKTAIPALVAFLHASDGADAQPRRSAFGALSAMRTDAVDALLELAGDPSPAFRAGAIGAIRGAGPRIERVVSALVAALDDADGEVRLAAIEGLGYLGSDGVAAVPALRARLAKDADDEDTTRATIEALGRMGPGARAAVPELGKALSGPMRQPAAEALERVGDAAASAALTAVLGEDAGLEERVAAAIARLQKDPRSAEARDAVEALGREGAVEKLDVRFSVAVALLRLDPVSKGARAVLLARLLDTEYILRARVLERLADVGRDGQDLVDRVDAIAATDPEERVRAAACGALASFGAADRALARLKPLLASDHDVARDAADALRRLGPAGAPLVPDVLRRIDDARRFIDRGTWIGALGGLGAAGDVVEGPLAGFLADADPLHRESRDAAAVALLELRRRVEVALPFVVARLGDLGHPLLSRAIAALSDLGPKAATAAPALERLTDHSSGLIREAARAALRRGSGK